MDALVTEVVANKGKPGVASASRRKWWQRLNPLKLGWPGAA